MCHTLGTAPLALSTVMVRPGLAICATQRGIWPAALRCCLRCSMAALCMLSVAKPRWNWCAAAPHMPGNSRSALHVPLITDSVCRQPCGRSMRGLRERYNM